ncbi:SNF2 family N-terminal domain-containing protein [Obelidium mucronatum]|nr:SNF2 family N-terminal domain-containing protein [Obelidium mucronatum]
MADDNDTFEPNEKQAQKRDAKQKRNQELANQSDDLRKKKAADSMKRYAYLLGQTDLFAHFINLRKMRNEDVSMLNVATENEKIKTDKRRKAAAADDDKTVSRRRMTEKEEDEALLQQEDLETDDTLHVFDESPAYVTGGQMRDYQIQGLNWLISLHHNGINGILADEMGLGKTLQTISFLGYLKHVEGICGKHLIIVPKSTLHNWMSEIKRWVPTLVPFLFHGDKEARVALVRDHMVPGNFEVCVTSYEMCLLEKSAFRKISWECLVIDEAHRIKNENSSLSQIVREFSCRNRLLITGTPLQNNLHELWALLNFLLPDIFSSSEDFENWFQSQNGDQDQVVQQLHKVLRPFLLRRIKADVEKSLLPKKRTNLYVGMSTMQRKWYQKILEKDIDAVNGSLGGRKDAGKTRLQNIVMQLRKCCNHPYLFDGAEPGPPFTTDEHLVDNAGKMAILDKLLVRMKASGSRVLLFSQMSRMLDILEDYCVFRGFDYCRIDGNTAHEDRISSIDEYNAPDSKKFIFLLTTRAGGLGINLATADIVVMYDNDWNPQVDLQAEDRAHRIGQKKQVMVFRFITENAIEEKVIDRATQKLRLDQLVIQQGRAAQNKVSQAASKDDLISMIQHGAQSIFQSSDSTISNDDIDEILRRGEAKTQELDSKYKNMGLDDVQNFMSDGGSVYQWEGTNFNQKKDGAKGGFAWIEPAKREKRGKFGSYAIDDYYRKTLNAGVKAPGRPVRTLKLNTAHDFQFYPQELIDIIEKESYFKMKEAGQQAVKRAPNPQVPEEDDDFLEKERADFQEKIDNAEPLTEEELEEKAELLKIAFEHWTRKDFMSFIRSNEKYGRDNLDAISNDVEGKTPEEVRNYAQVFWLRHKDLQDWEKYITMIERGEARIANQLKVQETLTNRIRDLKMPLQQLRLNYGQSKGKNYTEDEDRFMLVCLEKYGYASEDVYERMKEDIKQSPLFRFDWFIKSRTAAVEYFFELSKRCATLIMILQKDEEHVDGAGGGTEKKRAALDEPADSGRGEVSKRGRRKK